MLSVKTVNQATEAALAPAIDAWRARFEAGKALGDRKALRALMGEISAAYDAEWAKQHTRILDLAWQAATAEAPTYRRETAWFNPVGFRDRDYRANCSGRAKRDVKRAVGAFAKPTPQPNHLTGAQAPTTPKEGTDD